MAVEIKLPNLGDGIASGDVLNVLVKEGDQVQRDQGIVELETGKATIEVPSTHAGRVLKVHVKTGQTIPIGGTIISVEPSESPAAAPKAPAATPKSDAGQSPQAAPAPAPAKPAPAASSPAPQAPPARTSPAPAEAPARAAEPPQPARAPAPTPARTAPATPTVTAESASGPVAASPAVRRFAREVGVDLQGVAGTGEGGRITREDVLAVVRQANQAIRMGGSAPATAVSAEPAVSPSPKVASAPTPASTDGAERQTDPWGSYRIERMPRIRQTIAAKMHESWSTVPRVTNFDDADVTDLERIRQASKDDYADRGIKLTSLPFVVKAIAMALTKHPVLNASIDLEKGQIYYKEYVNIGIAVDSDRGLVVPSLRNADKLTIPEIARQIANMAEAIRSNSFSLDDLRGSTFTISNLGAIGGTYSCPIVNTPEVGILLVGRSRKMPVVIDDEIKVRLMMPMSLSYDHRLVDGAAAARFLNEVIQYLKAPSRLLLAP